ATRPPPGRPPSREQVAARSPRAPRQQRVALLLQQRPQDVDLELELTDLALRVSELALFSRPRPRPQPLAARLKELLPPGGDPPRRLPALTREQVERLAAQQPEHQLLLAARAPAHLATRLRLATRRAGAQPRTVHPNLPNS